MNVAAQRTYDAGGVHALMTRPDMWATVAEDGHDPRVYRPEVRDECWLRMTVDGVEIGLYQLQKRNAVTIEIHAQVLPECRKVYSKGSGLAALRWILDNAPECKKVIAWVPTIYPNVKEFTCSFGFIVEGINRKSYLKDGELHDQWLLGITTDEIENE